MYAWGSTINGELGLGGVEEEHILAPKLHEWALATSVINAALGDNHTLFLLKDGKVFSCGSNDYGQLGHMNARKRPQLVESLTPHNIVSVACGSLHSMALNKWGQVFTWGSDINGQLGHQMGQELQTVPKLVKTLAALHVVQIAAGSRHSVALTNSGDIYCWGANNFGQCGQGTSTTMEANPVVVSSLSGIPFATIACGGNHTFAVSKSGSIFGWGKNKSGQLGLNDELNKPFPTQLKTMRNQNVRFVSCGEEFSAFLTADGGVFTCGAGMYGQLGHGTNANEMLPRKISELMGSVTTQICCGRQHTLAFVPSRGRVYSFGLGGAGQLGLRKPGNSSVPQVVHGPWLSPSGNPVVPNIPHDAVGKVVKKMFAGGDHCFVTVMASKSTLFKAPGGGGNDRNEQCDFREYDPDRQILLLQVSKMEPCLKLSENGKVDQELLKYLEVVFKNPSCINGSFLMPDKSHYYCTSKNPGVDLKAADRFFQAIARVENKSIKELIWHSVVDDLMNKLNDSPPDVEALRIYLILPLYHEFRNRNKYKTLHKPFTKALGSLKPNADRVVRSWWSMTDRDYFERLISIFKDVVVYILGQQKIPENATVFYDPNLEAMLNTLAYLNNLNHSVDGLKVPYDTFHIPELGDFLDIRFDYLFWLSEPPTSHRLFLCNYPFIFNAHAKTQLLNTDQKIQMENAMQTAAQQAIISLIMNPTHEATIQQFLVLNVDRQNIVESTLRELSDVRSGDLKKPLKVKFHDEEAEDAGGVRKEFFMLLLRSILDPKYGMFVEHEETRSIWFSENTFEDDLKFFHLIGTICGLAIYNFTIIDIPFPLALYKKLLGEVLVLSDLRGLSPTTASSLQQILDYEGSDFEEVFFGLHFDIDRHAYGTTKTVELRPNGSKILVTQSNKKEYVDLYFKFILTKSIENQYNAFHSGFMNVCGGRVLKLFHSHELMAVVVGNENYDWHALEESAEYKGDYKSSDRTIRWFWEVVHAMSLADKKKFLLFLTGSYRIPIQGMKDIKIVIQPTNDEKYLPVAHTCFNLLDLPRYKTKERLRYKLMQAIQQTEGFSLV